MNCHRASPLIPALLLTACAVPEPVAIVLEPLQPWAEPIADAIAVGEERFPDGFRRDITALQEHEGRLWIGYGDGTANLGGETPVEFRWFESRDDAVARAAEVLGEGQGAPQRTPSDTGEEQINHYRLCGGFLCQAGSDSVNEDELWTQRKDPALLIEGNFFRLEEREGRPVWRKFRSVPGGEHVHDLAEFDGAIYAVGSGADVRAEFGVGEVFRYLWKSADGGATFETVRRVIVPVVGKYDTRFRHLLAVGDTLYVFGYVNPYVDGGPREGRSLRLRDGQLSDLTGPLAPLVTARTIPLSEDVGLAVAHDGEGRTRTFEVRADSILEIEEWRQRCVIDVTALPAGAGFLLLSCDVAAPARCSVHRFDAAEVGELTHVLECVGEGASALGWFEGALFVGTSDGRVLRALPRGG